MPTIPLSTLPEMLSKRAAVDMEALIASLMQMEEPITHLRAHLVQRRVPPQGRIFYSQTITGIAIHASIIAIVTICTYSRSRAGHLWLTRKQQGRTRLNATVIAMILAAVYSTTAMTYTALLLYVQHTGRYLPGSAAFEFSCFCSVSACISVICFTYYQSLPVGFESSLLRRMFGKSNAAANGRVFDFTLLWGWLVLSITGITVAPIVHDYWRRQIDDSIAGMLVYLDDPSTRQQGRVALLQISDKASILAQQLDKAVESVRIVVLVYMAHAVLFLCILVPVAFKLISLLNEQIRSLRQQAEDFFVLGSRMDIAKSQMDQTRSQIARNPTHSINRKPVPAIPLVHIDHTKSVTCHNCASEVPVAVSFADAQAWREKATLGPSEPVTHLRAFTPPPAPKRLQPRFQPPALPSHSEFPLIRAKRLQRVRLELVAFSVLLTAGLLAFIAGTAVMYILFPRWDSATVTLGFYTICLWCWAIPALTACTLYVYTTLALPRAASSCASTPTSRGSGPRPIPAEKLSSLKKITNKLASVGRLEKTDQEVELAARAERAEHLEPPRPLQLATRRTQPTYPRAPSISSVGMTTDAGRTERTDADTDAESLFVPPVPVLVRSGSRIKKWVDEGTERVNTDLLAPTTPKPTHAPPPSLYSIETVDTNYTSKRARKRSMGPVSQTQSWLDIDEDDR